MNVQSKILILFISLVIILSGCSYHTNVNTNGNTNQSESETDIPFKAEEQEIMITLNSLHFNLDKQFEDAALDRLDSEELSILRNSIYAKYGYIFSSKEYSEYFSQFSWYKPASKDVNDKFSTIDTENIKKIARLERMKEIIIKSSEDEADFSYDENGNIIFEFKDKKEILYITREDLETSDASNNPLKIKLKLANSEEVFESMWNDGIFVSVADFDETDNDIDVYITETGTDIQSRTYIYKFDGAGLHYYTVFSHFGRELRYDGKGKIYYWFNSDNNADFNTYLDYKTRQSGSITDEDIKTRVNKIL